MARVQIRVAVVFTIELWYNDFVIFYINFGKINEEILMAKSKKRKYKKNPQVNIIPQIKKTRFKNWLNNNKIYFETIMTLSLTIMSILISFVSLSFQQKSNELQEKQALIEAQLNMPVFNVSQTFYNEEYVIDGVSYPAGIEVNIINNGGNISNGYLDADAKIEILVHDKEYNSKGFVVIENIQRYMRGYSYYDAKTKSFTIKKDFDMRNIELRSFLYDQLHNDYENYSFTILMTDYINIQYNDFQNQFHNEWYELSGGELFKRSPVVSEQYKSLQINTMTNEEVYLEIKELLNSLLDIK